MSRSQLSLSDPPRVVGVIPARLASTRLPRKVLREVAGQPLLAWVYQAAAACPGLDLVVVAADSPDVVGLCQQLGFPCFMTSPHLPSGTDRIFALSRQLPADIYVNIQGDEPLLQPQHIDALLAPFARSEVEVTTLRVPCTPENIDNPNAVKVVTARDGRALYFSRAAIPFDRDENGTATYWKHLGLYAYRYRSLQRFAALPQGELEQIERLEQLRLLEADIPIHVADTEFDTVGVDTEEDLLRVSVLLQQRGAKP